MISLSSVKPSKCTNASICGKKADKIAKQVLYYSMNTIVYTFVNLHKIFIQLNYVTSKIINFCKANI